MSGIKRSLAIALLGLEVSGTDTFVYILILERVKGHKAPFTG